LFGFLRIGNALLGLARADESPAVLFLFPKGGVRVLPGQLYRIALNGAAGVFGWKYVKGGYTNGAASMNGKPLSSETPLTFLFPTFGAN
jgi:hypothetical protein